MRTQIRKKKVLRMPFLTNFHVSTVFKSSSVWCIYSEENSCRVQAYQKEEDAVALTKSGLHSLCQQYGSDEDDDKWTIKIVFTFFFLISLAYKLWHHSLHPTVRTSGFLCGFFQVCFSLPKKEKTGGSK
ncbi:hypothetical protein F511_35547 [Dorcoceras hygrometricum]|uniref:Uncharacterized protein n=1 Tax=Dorcoceras hygrometricum TaxID=472368 RepID=A0A2Z7CMD9_9LAMI|nr:hypothetical protein F511_35547 [Dorcoceras hygrometricum]